jgi:hypothetical protein
VERSGGGGFDTWNPMGIDACGWNSTFDEFAREIELGLELTSNLELKHDDCLFGAVLKAPSIQRS